jgi:hypothetical protein
MTDSDTRPKKLADSLDRTNELLEKNTAILEQQARVVKEIDDKVRKVVVNTST